MRFKSSRRLLGTHRANCHVHHVENAAFKLSLVLTLLDASLKVLAFAAAFSLSVRNHAVWEEEGNHKKASAAETTVAVPSIILS